MANLFSAVTSNNPVLYTRNTTNPTKQTEAPQLPINPAETTAPNMTRFGPFNPKNISQTNSMPPENSWVPTTYINLGIPHQIPPIPAEGAYQSIYQNIYNQSIELSLDSLPDNKNLFLGGCYIYLDPGSYSTTSERINSNSVNGALNFRAKIGDTKNFNSLTGGTLQVQLNVGNGDEDLYPKTYAIEIPFLPSQKDTPYNLYTIKLSDFKLHEFDSTKNEWVYRDQTLADALVSNPFGLETTGLSFMLSADKLGTANGLITFSDIVFSGSNPQAKITKPLNGTTFTMGTPKIDFEATLNQSSQEATYLFYQIDPSDKILKLKHTVPAIMDSTGKIATVSLSKPPFDKGAVYARLATSENDGQFYLSPTTTKFIYTDTAELSGTVPVSLDHISGQTGTTPKPNGIFTDNSGSVVKALGSPTSAVQLTYSWASDKDYVFAGILTDPKKQIDYHFLSKNVHLEFQMDSSSELKNGIVHAQVGLTDDYGIIYQFGADIDRVHSSSNKYSMPLSHFSYTGYTIDGVFTPGKPGDQLIMDEIISKNPSSSFSQITLAPQPNNAITNNVITFSDFSFTTESQSAEFVGSTTQTVLTETESATIDFVSDVAKAPYELSVCNNNNCLETQINESNLVIPNPPIGKWNIGVGGISVKQNKIWSDKEMTIFVTSETPTLPAETGMTLANTVPNGEYKIIDGTDTKFPVYTFKGDTEEPVPAAVFNGYEGLSGLYFILQDKNGNGYAGGAGISFPEEEWYEHRTATGNLVITGNAQLLSGNSNPITTGNFVLTIASPTKAFPSIDLKLNAPISWPQTSLSLKSFRADNGETLASLVKKYKDAYISATSIIPTVQPGNSEYLIQIEKIELKN